MTQLIDSSIASQFDRMPPASVEAERCLLASMMLDKEIVREKALLRQLIAASNDILRDAYAPHEQAELVLDKAEKRIFDIAQKKVGKQMVPMEDVLHEVFEMLAERGQRGLE